MKKRLYGIFEKVNGKWVRVPRYAKMSYYHEHAIRIFQTVLLTGGYELRPLPKKQQELAARVTDESWPFRAVPTDDEISKVI